MIMLSVHAAIDTHTQTHARAHEDTHTRAHSRTHIIFDRVCQSFNSDVVLLPTEVQEVFSLYDKDGDGCVTTKVSDMYTVRT